MFLNTKILLATLTLFAITGCVNTANLEQQQKITTLETSLITAQTLTLQTQAKLDSSQAMVLQSETEITELNKALASSQQALKAAQAKPVTPPPAPVIKPEVRHIDDKSILGQTEWVYISKLKENYKARIDTGAATSSINALDIERFERDGKKWVRFNLSHAESDEKQLIEARVQRIAKIKQSSNLDTVVERPVIQLYVRIGDVAHLTDFTLTDRSHMAYPVLIGRTFMRDVILVDVSKEYSFPPYQAPATQD